MLHCPHVPIMHDRDVHSSQMYATAPSTQCGNKKEKDHKIVKVVNKKTAEKRAQLMSSRQVCQKVNKSWASDINKKENVQITNPKHLFFSADEMHLILSARDFFFLPPPSPASLLHPAASRN